MIDYIVPMILAGVSLFALRKRENIYESLLLGAQDGLKLLISIVPSLILLLTAVHMLRASGAIDALTGRAVARLFPAGAFRRKRRLWFSFVPSAAAPRWRSARI